MALVSTQWLEDNLNKVKILDSSWHMPSTNRDGYNEYKKEHIINSIFFDIDKNSNQNINLPHMLPEKDAWEKIEARKERHPHWCLNALLAETFWGSQQYHYTAPVPGFLAVHEALRQI